LGRPPTEDIGEVDEEEQIQTVLAMSGQSTRGKAHNKLAIRFMNNTRRL
jgi:hypothetical protein